MKRAFAGFIILALMGCQSIQETLHQQGMLPSHCDGATETEDEYHSQKIAWLEYWQTVDELPWLERKTKISELGETPDDRVKLAILSFPADTPYQSRLRAQHYLQQSMAAMPDELAKMLKVTLEIPNQQLLELESALVTLNKANTDQAAKRRKLDVKIQNQQRHIAEMQKQIDALLKIETNLSAEEGTDE